MEKRKADWFVEEERTRSIIGGFFYVYNQLGYGFLESVYSLALAKVLRRKGHRVTREIKVPIYFENEILCYHRADMLIDDRIIVENKASFKLPPTAVSQTLSYLCATRLEVGLVFHFGPEAKFYRVANRSPETKRSVESVRSV